MNKKKALGLLIGIGVTLAAVNIVADKATAIFNASETTNSEIKREQDGSDLAITPETPPEDPEEVVTVEPLQEEMVPDIPEGMIRLEVLVAKARIGKGDIFTVENVDRIERNFPDNTEKSNLLVLSEDISFDQALEKIKGFKPVNALRPQDVIYLSRVDFDQEQVREEDLTRIELSLDQRVRFSDAGQVTLIHLEKSRSATGSAVVKIREALRNIPIVSDEVSGGAYLQFSSQSQRDFAQEILDAGGLIEIDMKTTAKVRRLSCGVETCLVTLAQFPELATSGRQSVEEVMPFPELRPVDPGTYLQAPSQPSQVQPSQAIPPQAEDTQIEVPQGSITAPAKPLTWAEKARLKRQQELEEANVSN